MMNEDEYKKEIAILEGAISLLKEQLRWAFAEVDKSRDFMDSLKKLMKEYKKEIT